MSLESLPDNQQVGEVPTDHFTQQALLDIIAKKTAEGIQLNRRGNMMGVLLGDSKTMGRIALTHFIGDVPTTTHLQRRGWIQVIEVPDIRHIPKAQRAMLKLPAIPNLWVRHYSIDQLSPQALRIQKTQYHITPDQLVRREFTEVGLRSVQPEQYQDPYFNRLAADMRFVPQQEADDLLAIVRRATEPRHYD